MLKELMVKIIALEQTVADVGTSIIKNEVLTLYIMAITFKPIYLV